MVDRTSPTRQAELAKLLLKMGPPDPRYEFTSRESAILHKFGYHARTEIERTCERSIKKCRDEGCLHNIVFLAKWGFGIVARFEPNSLK